MEQLKKPRLLQADEIECRVGTCNGKGVSLLLYKNARVDMNMLDEMFGAENWQREHYECKGNLFCRVGVRVADGWVWKSDCGTESKTEAEKGEASDSFKRACVNWGIGRELYSAPFIWVKLNDDELLNGKCVARFFVQSVDYDCGVITHLVITDKRGEVRYRYNIGRKQDKSRAGLIKDYLINHYDECKQYLTEYNYKNVDDFSAVELEQVGDKIKAARK